MSADIAKESHLCLLPGSDGIPEAARGGIASLSAAPFRPGELPLTAWIPLEQEARDLIWEKASEAALPTELWVRIAVEASRLANEISLLSDQPREEVLAGLDSASSEPLSGTQNLAASDLRRYAAGLREEHIPLRVDDVLALRLPEEISGAWRAAAAEARMEMPAWLIDALRSAPPGCVQWEEAAAVSSRSLGEWAYASWLRAAARAKA